MSAPANSNGRQLKTGGKIVFALGDHSVNVALSSLSLVFMFFLTDVAGLRPALAGWVVLLSRVFDAVTDPAMGRISDLTRTRFGRRRPYFLVGALPLGFAFAMLWRTPFSGQYEMAAYYTVLYMAVSLSLTILSVPYMALLPEMALEYQERTSLNAYRNVFTVFGTMLAASMPIIVEYFGGGQAGFAMMGLVVAIWMVVPWPFVFAVSFERPELNNRDDAAIRDALTDLVRHRSFGRLSAMYISSRIALDVSGMAFFYYFKWWIERPGDTSLALFALLAAVVAVHPFWVALGKHYDKHSLFLCGGVWWVLCCVLMFQADSSWPFWSLFAVAGMIGIGYAAVDLMPWSMLGEVIDEGELHTGARRDGIYNGYFTFVRKAGGGLGGFLAGQLLDITGYNADLSTQPENALLAIRSLTTVAPAVLLAIAAGFALNYPLGRARHQEIRAELAARRDD